jgi:hypothetical protein
VIKSEATPPPPGARIYGISAVALYEAVAPGAGRHRSLAGQINGLHRMPKAKAKAKHHWPAVANAALARTIRGIFPSLKRESLAAIDALEHDFAAQFQANVEADVYQRSVAQGQAVADAILAWAATDGYSTYNNYPYDEVRIVTSVGEQKAPVKAEQGEVTANAYVAAHRCGPLHSLPSSPSCLSPSFSEPSTRGFDWTRPRNCRPRSLAR